MIALKYFKSNVKIVVRSMGRQERQFLSTGVPYAEQVIRYMERQQGPVCVLGRAIDGESFVALPWLRVAAVLPSESRHRENVRLRARSAPGTAWANEERVWEARRYIQYVADKHGLPIYPSFEAAMADLTQGVGKGMVSPSSLRP
jgi:hypothetical protein